MQYFLHSLKSQLLKLYYGKAITVIGKDIFMVLMIQFTKEDSIKSIFNYQLIIHISHQK